MPPQRTTRFSNASGAVAHESRHLPLQGPPSDNPSTTQQTGGPSAGIRRAIAKEARLLKKHDKLVAWGRLSERYRLPVDTLHSICSQAKADSERRQQKRNLVARAADRRKLKNMLNANSVRRRQLLGVLVAIASERRQQQSALVARAAERHFDNALCQCNWEAVASELDTPLIECLDLFNAADSIIRPLSLIGAYGGWSRTDMEKLRMFIADNYADSSTVNWKLAGAYMNVCSLECQRVEQATYNEPVNGVAYRRIQNFCNSGMSWNDIHEHFLQYPNVTSLQTRWCWLKITLEVQAGDSLSAEWTDAERELIKDLINRHVQSATRSELVDIIKCELPARLLSDIHLLSGQYIYELETRQLHVDQMTRLQDLVVEYGKDWDRIGKELGVLPSRARHNWIMYGGDAVQLLVESPPSCQVNTTVTLFSDPGQQDDALSGSTWTAADDETLLKIVNSSGVRSDDKWERVSQKLGRSVLECRVRFSDINLRFIQGMDDRECQERHAGFVSHASLVSLVTSKVQWQFDLSGAVDWTQVSQAMGLGICECYELSQYDVGKDSWQYDPDTFSQSMANWMTCCIKEHYPAPVPVNYRAVSNYMWVDMKDFIHMHSKLQGKFKWTVADYEQAAALKAQGLTFKEVARHLSPALCPKNVARALKRYSSPKPIQMWFTADEMEEISRLVDEYVGKYPVVEIVAKISKQIEIRNRRNYHYTVSRCIAVHPHYQDKLDSIDYTDLALRIAHGQMTVSLVVKELDVPHSALTNRLQTINRKQYSPIWTDEDIHKLVNYTQTCNSKPDYCYFSNFLGTKSPRQCYSKTAFLRSKDVLPPISKSLGL